MSMEALSNEDPRIGQLYIGKYKLDKHLGSGAMGDVYRAENVMLGRIVAIKMLRPEHANNKEVVERFLREGQAANRVRHPNVVDMIDVGADERGAPYIVQEFLEGEDLAHYIEGRGGKLDAMEAIDIMLPVIEAIEFAHARGVVHRDLKPENIFLALEGTRKVPKLLDFGISQVRTGDSVRMTATGLMMGTPAYMSPEQIVRGAREADAQTDVWALGVILFEALGGALPFMAETASALFVDIATKDAPSLHELDPALPPQLVKVVARCLRRERADRYPTGCELARDLRHWKNGEEVEGTAVRSIPPPPNPAKAAALLAEMDVPSLTGKRSKKEVITVDQPLELPSAPKLAAPRSAAHTKAAAAAPSSAKKRTPTMQEMMDEGGSGFDDEEDESGDLELDVPYSNPGGAPMTPQPQSRKGSGLHVDGGGRNAPLPIPGHLPAGFHAPPSSARNPGYGGEPMDARDQGPNLSMQDVMGFTALALLGILVAGMSRYFAHREDSALRPILESMKGLTLLAVPAFLCAGLAVACGWQAAQALRAEAKVKAGFIAAFAGILIAAAFDLFGSM